MRVEDVSITSITVSPSRRPVSQARVKALSASILEIGLQHPVGLTTAMRLIHGRHRMEAYRMLGWAKIPAIIHEVDELHAELAEIDENIQRSALSALEESKALARRKELYEAIHPETKHGATGRGRGKSGNPCHSKSFADDTAEKTGRSARSVRDDVAIGSGISDDVAEQLSDTPIANNKTELRKLAAIDEKDQRKAVKALVSGKATTVDEALGRKREATKKAAKLFDGEPTPEQIEAVEELEQEAEEVPDGPKPQEVREALVAVCRDAFDAGMSLVALHAQLMNADAEVMEWTA